MDRPRRKLRVLLVEDSPDDAFLLERELTRLGYDFALDRVETAPAMARALEGGAYDIVISDYSLPEFNAPAALAVLQGVEIDLPFVIVSGTVGEETAISSLKAGAADFIVKGSFARLGPAIERELAEAAQRRARRQAEIDLHRSRDELAAAYEFTLQGWARALELRDAETEGHSHRVTDLTVAMGRLAGLSEPELVHLRRGALLHDIGKMGVPDSILLKPGPLDDNEWAAMRRHPTFAYEMLQPIEFLRPALDVPLYHHERWDGTGYPQGLAGEDIPLGARLFAVVDVWDALSSPRPYKDAWPASRVDEHLRTLRGSHFDPQAVDVFEVALRRSREEAA